MYGIVLMAAMTSGGQAADCVGYHGAPVCHGSWCGAGWGHSTSCRDCCPPRCGCCGYVIPGLAGYGPGAPSLPAAEQKKWDDYVASLNNDDDRKDLGDLWNKADIGARRKLVSKIPPPMQIEEEKKEVVKEKPLSAEEIKQWEEYVQTLKGDAKKKAEDAWRKADLAGKRKMIATIPEKD